MGRTLRIETPRVYLPLLQPSRYKGAYGGRGSGKSHAFADLLIERCLMRRGTRAVCVREVQRSLEQSVKRLLEDKIQRYGLGDTFRVLNTHIETPGDGIVIFQGMQSHTAETIKSLEGYDVAWVEEAQSLSQRSLDLLRPTIRKPESELWFSWNPRHETDPVDVLLRRPDRPPDAIVVEANWRDNPWFPEVLRAEMEWDRSRAPEKYAHVWLGKYEKRSEARVFKKWRTEEFETLKTATFYFGADWGFSVDPTVLVRAYIVGRTLFIDRERYRIGCEIEDTPALFDSLACAACARWAEIEAARAAKRTPKLVECKDPNHAMARRYVITADSARPETISHMQRHDYPRVEPARKGPGSVEEGVTFLQDYDIVVHPRCVHTIDELTLYSYKTDPVTGIVLPVLEDKKNHVIDSLRYSVEPVRKPQGRVRDAAWG